MDPYSEQDLNACRLVTITNIELVLDDDGQLLQLVEFAQCLQIVKHDIDRSFKYQRRHEILQLLSVDPRRDHVLQLIDLSEHL